MSDTTFTQLLNLLCGALLLSAVMMVWRRRLTSIVRLLTVQGVLLAALAALLGVREASLELAAVAAGVLVLKAMVLPAVLRRVVREGGDDRDAEPLVNVVASLLAAALLTLLAYAVARPLVALDPSPATRAIPVGLALVFLGFFLLVTRRRAVSQLVGFLLLDNGIATTAFLATAGVPLMVELGVSLELLLVVLVLEVLTARLRIAFGLSDLDELREVRV
jgi:hydrogenase-4 component E